MEAIRAGRDALTLRANEVRFFWRGLAYGFAAPELVALRGTLTRRWEPWLGEQDRRPFRPHITIQNKVPAEQARALYEEMRALFTPFSIGGTGLLLWRYRGGPWEAAGEYPFVG